VEEGRQICVDPREKYSRTHKKEESESTIKKMGDKGGGCRNDGGDLHEKRKGIKKGRSTKRGKIETYVEGG